MDTCPHMSLVGAFHDGELPEPRHAEMRRHVSECAQCAAELEELRRVSRFLASGPAVSISSGMAGRLHEHVDVLMDRSVLRFAQMLSGIAAAVLIAAGGWLMGSPPARPEPVSAWETAAVTLGPQTASEPDSMHTARWMVTERASRR